MIAIRQFLQRIRLNGTRRAKAVTAKSMGIERTFDAYDVGPDTYVLERGILARLKERPSVLIVEKSQLRRRARGRVFTLSSGNHAVAAFPLLDGRFWKLANLSPERRGEVLMHAVLCSNVVNGVIETSQREIPTADLVRHDRWLQETAGFSLSEVVMGDRNEATLDYYRRLGQEWRVKPLAWSESEMRVALAASRKRMGAQICYFHSARGVHLLTFPEFRRFAGLAESDPAAFVRGLRELVGVYEGNATSFARMVKYRGHHEIEFFGVKRGTALATLVPEIERLLEAVDRGETGQLGVIQRAQELVALFESLLSRPEFADETSKAFVETLYMYVTGEVYAVVGEGTTPAFDDRRTALPGATFVDGRLTMHPGSDSRSEVLLSNLRGMLSKGEVVEYANVYELREDESTPVGKGRTREVVYKTNLRPLEASLVEKGLSSKRKGYGDYMLARIGALRALGIGLSAYYRLLRRRAHTGRVTDFYIRTRCEGEPMESIPAAYFHRADGAPGEETEVVLSLASLMGDAAAQNMAMKKFDPVTESPLYGVGKEIYEFEYDLMRETVVPKRVATCSIRGSLGWPDLEYTDLNLNAIAGFYLTHFAHALKIYQRQHAVPMADLAERFMSGFEFRTHALAWQLSVMRDLFEDFRPPVDSRYGFDRKWKFAMWSLERQERRLPALRRMFFEKVRVEEAMDLTNSQKGTVTR